MVVALYLRRALCHDTVRSSLWSYRNYSKVKFYKHHFFLMIFFILLLPRSERVLYGREPKIIVFGTCWMDAENDQVDQLIRIFCMM